MAASTIRVLLVEDSSTDALVTREELESSVALAFVVTHVPRLRPALEQLSAHPFDVVLLDLSLPDSDGLSAFTRLRSVAPRVPVIVLSHRDDEQMALEAVQAGAQDYLVKGQPEGLMVRAIRYALERTKAERELRRSEAALNAAQRFAGVGSWVWHIPSNRLEWSDEMYRIFGIAKESFSGDLAEAIARAIHPDDRAAVERSSRALIEGIRAEPLEYRVVGADGAVRFVSAEACELRRDDHGHLVEASGVVQDITHRRRLDDTFRFLAQQSGEGEGFFRPLARYLAGVLGTDYVFIDRLVREDLSAETLAVFCNGTFDDNFIYDLKDTPCAEVIGHEVCVFPSGVCERFPRDAALQTLRAESYIGITLCSAVGKPIGLIALISRRPIETPLLAESILRVVAVRAAGELEREQAAEALRTSNQLLEASQSMAKMGGWELDLATNRLFWTAEMFRLHDTTPAEFHPTVDAGVGYFLPESRRIVSAAMQAAKERGEGYDLVLEKLTTKGRRIDVRTTCEVTLHEGRPVKLTGIFQDIGEQLAAEAVLRSSRQQLATAMSLANMADWELDLVRGDFLFNDRIYVLFGTTAEREGGYEMPAQTFFRELCHPEDAGRVGEHVRQAMTSPRIGVQHFEYRLRRRDSGAVRHMVVHYQITIDAAGRPIHASGSLVDITERRQAELAREESEGQLKAVIDHAMDAIVILDGQQRIVLFNASAERIFGRASAEMLGQSLDLLIPSLPRVPQQQHLSRLATTGAVRRDMGSGREAVALRADGKEFPIESSIATVLAGDRQLSIAIVRDITARKAAEAEREAMQAQLQQAQKLDSIGQLAGGVAHDFNNMLSVILGTTELALAAAPPGGEMHADLLEIRTAAERSAALTRQLLAFARQETIVPRMLDLNETVDGMLTMLRRLIGEDLQMTWAPGASLGKVKMDPSQVDQLLANLCINARDAVTGVGTVSIGTASATLDEAQLQGDATPVSGAFVRLTVSDTGSGMDARTLARIFEPFFTTKEQGKGTGLGLATVYGIVKQNGGAIDVTSELGKGTTFSIYLPRYEGTNVRNARASADGAGAGGGETVLVVDDEPAILLLCRRFLTSQGYRVLAASTPREALQLAADHESEIRLLITDVIMPEMSGRQLSEHLLARYPNLRCLFMSGYTADVIATRGVLEEGVDFIQKPFLTRDLATKVRSMLDAIARAADRVS